MMMRRRPQTQNTQRWVETDTISNTACWIEFPTAVNKNVICISGAHGKSTCNVSKKTHIGLT